jgi:hypothetical protein
VAVKVPVVLGNGGPECLLAAGAEVRVPRRVPTRRDDQRREVSGVVRHGHAEGLAPSRGAGGTGWAGTCAQPSRPTRARCDQRRPFRPMSASGVPRRAKSRPARECSDAMFSAAGPFAFRERARYSSDAVIRNEVTLLGGSPPVSRSPGCSDPSTPSSLGPAPPERLAGLPAGVTLVGRIPDGWLRPGKERIR